MQNENASRVLKLLIDELSIPVTQQSVVNELQMHPDYPSLLAISDVLNNWRVPNASYQLSFKELIEAEVQQPFIAQVRSNGGEFLLINNVNEKHAIVSNHQRKKHVISIEEFKKNYTGFILIAEKETHSGEPGYPRKYRKEIINNLRGPVFYTGSIITLLSLLFLHTSYISSFTVQVAFLTLFKTIGLITSILLLVQSIDSKSPLIQKVCGVGDNKNCNAILSSKAAKISDEVNWSDIGFFYFAGTWLVLLFNSSNTNLIQMLAILNLVSLPYTFYSIYYQWRIAKQWCAFCCMVQALLWFEFFSFLPSIFHGIQRPGLSEWSSMVTGMAIPILAWIFLKPYFLQSTNIQPLKQQLRKFKYNAELFEKSLNDEIRYALPTEEHSLILGNREAEHIITMVSNPYCQPCSQAHNKLDEWLTNRDDIKLQVIFSTDNDENGPKTKIVSHLLSMQNDLSLKSALNDWYKHKHKNYETWAKNYPISENLQLSENLKVQMEWCKMAEVTGTPTIFINGRRLPSAYQIEDIKYFI